MHATNDRAWTTHLSHRGLWLIGVALALAAAASGCTKAEPTTTLPVNLHGTIQSPRQQGTMHVVFYEAMKSANGNQEPQLRLMDHLDTTANSFRRHLEFPSAAGEQLLVWVWVDSNSDGRLCARGSAAEPTGLTALKPFSPGAREEKVAFAALPGGGGGVIAQRFPLTVNVNITLATPCQSAATLYAARGA